MKTREELELRINSSPLFLMREEDDPDQYAIERRKLESILYEYMMSGLLRDFVRSKGKGLVEDDIDSSTACLDAADNLIKSFDGEKKVSATTFFRWLLTRYLERAYITYLIENKRGGMVLDSDPKKAEALQKLIGKIYDFVREHPELDLNKETDLEIIAKGINKPLEKVRYAVIANQHISVTSIEQMYDNGEETEEYFRTDESLVSASPEDAAIKETERNEAIDAFLKKCVELYNDAPDEKKNYYSEVLTGEAISEIVRIDEMQIFRLYEQPFFKKEIMQEYYLLGAQAFGVIRAIIAIANKLYGAAQDRVKGKAADILTNIILGSMMKAVVGEPEDYTDPDLYEKALLQWEQDEERMLAILRRQAFYSEWIECEYRKSASGERRPVAQKVIAERHNDSEENISQRIKSIETKMHEMLKDRLKKRK